MSFHRTSNIFQKLPKIYLFKHNFGQLVSLLELLPWLLFLHNLLAPRKILNLQSLRYEWNIWLSYCEILLCSN